MSCPESTSCQGMGRDSNLSLPSSRARVPSVFAGCTHECAGGGQMWTVCSTPWHVHGTRVGRHTQVSCARQWFPEADGFGSILPAWGWPSHFLAGPAVPGPPWGCQSRQRVDGPPGGRAPGREGGPCPAGCALGPGQARPWLLWDRRFRAPAICRLEVSLQAQERKWRLGQAQGRLPARGPREERPEALGWAGQQGG